MDAGAARPGVHRPNRGIAPATDAFGQVTVNLAYWTVDHLRYRFTPDNQVDQAGDPATND